MFNKKYKEKIFNLEKALNKTQNLLDDYKLENYKLKKEIQLKEKYKKYDYAILIEKGEFNNIKVWNKGRFETDIKELYFEKIGNDIFDLTIKK